MDYDQNDTDDIAGSHADFADAGNQPSTQGSDNVDSGRPSAIERQRAAMQPAAARHLTDHIAPQPKRTLPNSFSDDGHNGSRLIKRTRFALLLAAASLVLAVIAFRTPIMGAAAQAEREVAQFTKSLQKAPAPTTSAEVAAATGITVPISEVSLRVRPELLQQLVAVFRLRLANAPHDAEVNSILVRLREHSLAELEVISATEDAPLAANSLNFAAKLFPELVYDPRYQSLAARIDKNPAQNQQQAIADSAVGTEHALAATPALSSQSVASATTATAQQAIPAVSDTKPINPAPMPAVLPATERSTGAASKTDAAAVAAKPEIHVTSLTPGIIEGERFVPTDGGNVFMLVINYRNLGNGLNQQPGGELVTQLGSSHNPRLSAEVPVEITGSSGKKSFLIGTLERGHTGEAYKLNFILNGQVLPTRTAHLTLATYADNNI
ncbi:MAG: hypothetical protein JWM78_964 [Verrucomicrobiaceae bacterium]|nr:hypothetical protein [Verrucomicrobiaceae bacterium]